jgi:peptide/nickel transport system ATP-binding protein
MNNIDSKIILEAQDLCKCFYTRDAGQTHALDHVSLKVYTGEVLALIGESGSGKSTLGRALLRLLPLDQGDILWQGKSILPLRGHQLRLFRQHFQMIFQNQQANLHPRMNVVQMLDESLRLHRPSLTESERRAKIESLLQEVGLTQHHHRYIASLSGGEQRRVGLARILATQPTLIVADEPTSGLDAAIKLQMIELLKSIKGSELTYLLISHDLNLVRSIADRVLVMLRGRLIEEVSIQDLGKIKHHPYTEKLLAAADLGERNLEILTVDEDA